MKSSAVKYALSALLFILLAVGPLFGQKTVVYNEDAPKPIGPYSQAIIAGNMVFVSGQIALDEKTGKIIDTDIKDETDIVMNNIKKILEKAGYKMEHIVKTTIFITDMKNFKEINEVYSGFFTGEYPARETVQVAALPKNARVEISVIAMK